MMHEVTPADERESPAAETMTRVEDKYFILEKEVVGRGAWSVVKKCVPIPPYTPPGSSPHMKFVVKVIEKDYLISLTKGDVDRAMGEVKREIDVLRHIPPHENVVTFVEHVETEKLFLLFFEEVRCGDLCELILQTPDAKLPEEKCKLYTYQIIKAVLHCHLHDVIHRDIKPENLLVSDDDNIKLTDFGLAKRAKGDGLAEGHTDPLDIGALIMPYPGCERLLEKRIVCSDVIGTPRYGAPEMFYAKFTQSHYDGYKADAWSIGVVTFITLSGSFPYSTGANASEKEIFRSIMDSPLPVPPGISSIALDFLQCLLNKDPCKRITLYDALTHPWLASVMQPRGSVVVSQLRAVPLPAAVEDACARFDDEARLLHRCIANLQRENAVLRMERDDMLENKYHTSRHSPRRAEDSTVRSRVRSARSPRTSMRVASPASSAVRPRIASRDGSSSSLRRVSASNGRTARTRSPLVRSLGGAVRRGTPARTGGTTPVRSMTPSRSVANGRNASVARTSMYPRPASSTRAMTPNGVRGSTPSRGTAAQRSRTPLSSVSASQSSGPVIPANELHVGDQVTYKGYRAVVRFNGTTTFGAGVWIGLEMLEGNEGTNNGSSFIDKKQYFTCPKGKGVFVRASQVKWM